MNNMRNIKFQIGEYYHIYNRGTDKREIFMDKSDYLRFIRNMEIFSETESLSRDLVAEKGERLKKQVKFICYCLNPNHYHFLLKQSENKGIEKFMHRLGVGYSTYFNKKYNRSGVLFQGPYKAIHIKENSYFIWLSAYINGNSEIHKIFKAENYQWSSYMEYLERRNSNICNKNNILDQFKNINEYKDFVDLVIQERKEGRAERKKYILE